MSSDKNIGGLIITYNPELSRLKQNIDALKKQVEYVVIVDNGSENITELQNLIKNQNIQLITNHSNVGIAAALNLGILHAKKDNLSWIITLDQDSILPPNAVASVKKEIALGDNSVAIYALNYIDEGWNESELKSNQREFKGIKQVMQYVITSGNFLRISAWEKIGGFDEGLFIDWVDFDLDERLTGTGYKIVQLNTVIMEHRIGDSSVLRFSPRLIGFDKGRFISDHSPMRQYYYFRNKVIFRRRYEKNLKNKMVRIISITLETRRVLLYPQTFKKGIAALRGIKDGLFYKI